MTQGKLHVGTIGSTMSNAKVPFSLGQLYTEAEVAMIVYAQLNAIHWPSTGSERVAWADKYLMGYRYGMTSVVRSYVPGRTTQWILLIPHCNWVPSGVCRGLCDMGQIPLLSLYDSSLDLSAGSWRETGSSTCYNRHHSQLLTIKKFRLTLTLTELIEVDASTPI